MRLNGYEPNRDRRWYETIGVAIVGVCALLGVAAVMYGAVAGPVFVLLHVLDGAWRPAAMDAVTVAASWLVIWLQWALLGY